MDNQLKQDLDEAIEIINNLITGIEFLPQSWDDMVTLEVSQRVKEFMQKHDPERWGSTLGKHGCPSDPNGIGFNAT